MAEESPLIRMAIVCGLRATILADSLETLLAEAKGFRFSRFEYRTESGLKPNPACLSNPDVVVATLGPFQGTNLGAFFLSLERAFPRRSVLVSTTHPNTFD